MHRVTLPLILAVGACDEGSLGTRESSKTQSGAEAAGGASANDADAGRRPPNVGSFDPLGGPRGGETGGGAGPNGGDTGEGGQGRPGGYEPPPPPPAPPKNARSASLVSFGCTPEDVEFGVQGWNSLLRDAEHTEWVKPDGDPTHCGLSDRPGAPERRSFMGVQGGVPIAFDADHQIAATVFHRSGHDGQRLRMRVSFTDTDAPEGATNAAPWYTMVVEAESGSPRVGQTGIIAFNLTTAETVACETAPPTVGEHGVVNVSFDYPDSVPGQWVLTRLDLTNHVDRTPPTRPRNLTVRPIVVSPEAGRTALELTWDKPADQPGDNGGVSGISRYFVYRDGEPYDLVSKFWTAHFGDKVRYIDLGVLPGESHHYAVTALDGALTGLYPILENLETRRAGNESAPAEADAVVPESGECRVIGPGQLEYLGAFAAPRRDDWAYSGHALTFFPRGNPQRGGDEGAGSLYVTSHVRDSWVGELSIPEPIAGRGYDALHEARILQDAVDIWPRAYNGNWQPAGAVETRVGLAYHPGVDGVGEGIHYSIFMSYSGDLDAAVHGMFDLDLTRASGPWHIGGLPGSDARVDFRYTGKFVTALPQAWADAHTGGRSLMVGLGWPVSGHGFPSAGPTFGAIAPWESGRLPDQFGVISHQSLLRYGTTGEEDRWQNGWTQSHFYTDAEFLEVDGAQAVVVGATRPRGDEWYGGENGYDNFYCDADVPPHIGSASLRGPVNSDNVPVLYFYNPADFARVRSGDWQPHQPQPFAMLDLDAVLFDETDERFPRLSALAWDPGRQRLYAWENGATRFGHAAVHAWQVSAPACP